MEKKTKEAPLFDGFIDNTTTLSESMSKHQIIHVTPAPLKRGSNSVSGLNTSVALFCDNLGVVLVSEEHRSAYHILGIAKSLLIPHKGKQSYELETEVKEALLERGYSVDWKGVTGNLSAFTYALDYFKRNPGACAAAITSEKSLTKDELESDEFKALCTFVADNRRRLVLIVDADTDPFDTPLIDCYLKCRFGGRMIKLI